MVVIMEWQIKSAEIFRVVFLLHNYEKREFYSESL